jgi:hypothetical protein
LVHGLIRRFTLKFACKTAFQLGKEVPPLFQEVLG